MRERDIRLYLSASHDEVTGSRFDVNVIWPDKTSNRFLVDMGLFQEISYKVRNYVDSIDYSKIDAILVTHSHVDHVGRIPMAVKQGYNNPIFMTEISHKLVGMLWEETNKHQRENIAELQKKYNIKFEALFARDDIKKAKEMSKGIEFWREFEVVPGIYATFLENGHLLGASMIYIRIEYPGYKEINLLFTGDYKPNNTFFNPLQIPFRIRQKEDLIIISEATYGDSVSTDVEMCFESNLQSAFRKRKNILVGAFAQGRMQEILYLLKQMQAEKKIPEEYQIFMDGALGIKFTNMYKKILSEFNPEMSEFIPYGLNVVEGDERKGILSDGIPKIIITTSGMLSNGPAREYVPMFIGKDNCMIHLTGYAAEGTLARKILDSKKGQDICIGDKEYVVRADVFSTQEFSSHAKSDELINLLDMFSVRMLIINHGEKTSKDKFAMLVTGMENIKEVGIVDAKEMYLITQHSYASYDKINVRNMTTKYEEPLSYLARASLIQKKKKEKRITKRFRRK